MRRVCNQQELKILARSKKDILSDTFAKNHGNGAWNLIFGILLGCIVGGAICIPLAYKAYDAGVKVNETVLSVGLTLFLNFLIVVMTAVVSVWLKKIGFSRDTSKFFKNKVVEVNGATIVQIDTREGFFSFIEDDFTERFGSRLYIIDYPLISANAGNLKVGDRIMVVRTSDGAYIPMKLSDKTINFVERFSPIDINSIDLWNSPHIPHPNVDIIDKQHSSISEREKEEFIKSFKKTNRNMKRGICITISILLVVIMFLIFCVMVADEVITYENFGIWGVGFIALVALLIIGFVFLVKNVGVKRAKRASYRKSVMFNYSTMDSNGQTEVWVYEYTNGVLGARMYSNPIIEKNISYGTVLQKYYGKKFECFIR